MFSIIQLQLLSFAGVCSGLQYPFSYEYDYFGSVRTGVPSRGNEYGSAALSAKLFVTVASESEAHVQVRKISFLVKSGYH